LKNKFKAEIQRMQNQQAKQLADQCTKVKSKGEFNSVYFTQQKLIMNDLHGRIMSDYIEVDRGARVKMHCKCFVPVFIPGL